MRARTGGGFWLLLPGYLAFLWPFYPHSPGAALDLTHPPGPVVVGAGAILLLGAVAGLAVAIQRRSRAAVPWSLAAFTLMPVLAVNAWRGTLLFAERFFYLPSAGVIWALAVHAQGLPRAARRTAVVLAAALVLAGAWRTASLEPDWANDETLFRSMTRLHPGNVTGHLQLARELDRQGRAEEAARAAGVASRLDPTRPDVLGLRAVLELRAGRADSALALADRAVAGGSLQLEPRLIRATALAALGRFDAARGAIDSLRARLPGNPAVESLWGQFLYATGHPDQAVPVLEGAARLLPEDVDVSYALGLARVAIRDWPGAAAALERTVALRPSHYEAWLQLGASRLERGDRVGAAAAFASAARLPEAADGRAAGLLRMVSGSR
jgi:cytochrome c-type biogenesis protein CcmH/NrfG